ncbi:unnamed protein product [Spirodela intermedia]|uniref:Uncharacterized protein n=1 Tax=Spirodela intermedia TaxID=51605 RepID=A0A7I8JT14_SPIIN|nr:unnamed protein product [Spirodela intermedia]CAA6672905.1 unnamed protein product [Spirodela intermedia]
MRMDSVNLQWKNLPKNVILRNDVTFYFQRSLTSVYWNGMELANATGPSGKTGARRIYRMGLNLDDGVLKLNSSTTVNGHVKVFGMFHHHVDVFINCTISLDLWKETITDQLCNESVSV